MTDHRPLHIGPHTHDPHDPRHPHDPVEAHEESASTFDREIDLRAILYSGAGLLAIVVVFSFLMWWMLRGFAAYDRHHDVRLSPIETASPQAPPPSPRLQVAPGFEVRNPGEVGQPTERSDREDMAAEREREDAVLHRAGWIDQAQGTARVPIDVAMQVIAARGVAPEVVGGHPGAAQPPAVPAVQQNELAGTRQPAPPPVPQERRQP